MINKNQHNILKIAVPAGQSMPLDYLVSTEWLEKAKPGCRVRVPFRNSEKIGVIVAIADKSKLSQHKLKAIIEIIDTDPLFSATDLLLMQWISDYYHVSLAEVIFASLPKSLRLGKSTPEMNSINEIKLTTNEIIVPSPYVLHEKQKSALERIIAAESFTPFCLQGVTGSGKTEVYLQAIAVTLQRDQQALILVPEIALTPQTTARFKERFRVPIAIVHSGMSDKERVQAFLQAKTGVARIVIGTRSAIFTPMPKLGMIIIDEEHDTSYKQYETIFRYHARDVAVMRAKLLDIPIVLGSATPSLETLYNCQLKKYQHLLLPERVGTATLPKIHLIDVRQTELQQGCSPDLLRIMRQHLQAKKQVLILINRRGFAPVLICHHCGFIHKCKGCDLPLVLHKKNHNLQCHHCGFKKIVSRNCEQCHFPELIPLGQGTERIEEFLQQQFPEYKILRIDRDSVRKKNAWPQIIDQINNHEADILIGTQMLAKGHHFPNVTMTAMIDADSAFYSGELRATERFGQLFMQVAGRAGRGDVPGEFYLQTHQPEQPLLQLLLKHDYQEFAAALLAERQKAHMPPFTAHILIHAEHKKSEKLAAFFNAILKFPQNKYVKRFGAVPNLMAKKAGMQRMQCLVQAENRKHLQLYLSQWLLAIAEIKLAKNMRWMVDVDPVDYG